MTAPIVFHASREPRSERSIAASCRFDGDEHLAQIADGVPVTPGQLWERVGGQDVLVHDLRVRRIQEQAQ